MLYFDIDLTMIAWLPVPSLWPGPGVIHVVLWYRLNYDCVIIGVLYLIIISKGSNPASWLVLSRGGNLRNKYNLKHYVQSIYS